MKVFLLLAILATTVVSDKNKWGVEHKDEVSTLTKDNFDEFIKTHKQVFVKFYAPWCGHCKSMAPSYAKLAAKMNARADGIPIAEVDSTENTELSERFGVEGYPTLKFFVDGEPVDYQGEREGDAIENFINKKLNPSAKELKTDEEIQEVAKSKLSAVLVLESADAEQLAIFNIFSGNYDFPFYYTTLAASAGVTSRDKYHFVVFRNFEDGKKVLSSNELITSNQMKTFFESVRYPTLIEFDQEAAEKIFGSEETAIFLFSDETTNDQIEMFKTVAKEKKGELTFSKSSITEGMGQRLAEFLGITEADKNLIVLIKFDNGNVLKYKLDSYDKDKLNQFLDDFKAEKLTPFFKSDPIPESNSDPVKVIVGKNFDELILNNDKWVLLEVYAPWCGHCKKLAPIYDDLAKKVSDHSDIVIAKMDGTTNENALITIKGFPTLKFFRKDDKQNPIDFEGDRTLEGFLSFLEKETGKKLGASEAKSDVIVDESL